MSKKKETSQLIGDIDQTFMVEGHLLLHCGPIFYYRTVPFMCVCGNGTYGLVDTGKKKLLVTCAHVWTGYQEAQAQQNLAGLNLAILVGTKQPLHITHEPLCVNEQLDLATWDMEPLMSEFTDRQFYSIPNQKLPPLKPKDVLASIGYTGEGREVFPLGVDFRYHFSGLSVSDTSGPIVMANMSTSKMFGRDGRRIPAPEHFGGVSGSPVYVLQQQFVLKMVGFVTSSGLDALRITHISCLSQDGTISRPTD